MESLTLDSLHKVFMHPPRNMYTVRDTGYSNGKLYCKVWAANRTRDLFQDSSEHSETQIRSSLKLRRIVNSL